MQSFLRVSEVDVDRKRPHRNVKTVKGTRDIHHVKEQEGHWSPDILPATATAVCSAQATAFPLRW